MTLSLALTLHPVAYPIFLSPSLVAAAIITRVFWRWLDAGAL